MDLRLKIFKEQRSSKLRCNTASLTIYAKINTKKTLFGQRNGQKLGKRFLSERLKVPILYIIFNMKFLGQISEKTIPHSSGTSMQCLWGSCSQSLTFWRWEFKHFRATIHLLYLYIMVCFLTFLIWGLLLKLRLKNSVAI